MNTLCVLNRDTYEAKQKAAHLLDVQPTNVTYKAR